MPSRTLSILALVSAILAAATATGPGGTAVAGEHRPSAVVAIHGLTLRAAPSTGARALRRLPILTEVIPLHKPRKPATIGGRKDAWLYVQANYCPDPLDTSPACETVLQRGWVAESYLAANGRFEPLTKWRAGAIEVDIEDEAWRYVIAADGSFSFESESWSYFRKSDPCPAEEREGGFCVHRESKSGQLLRHRDVVRAGDDGRLLYIDKAGALCDPWSSRRQRMCDR